MLRRRRQGPFSLGRGAWRPRRGGDRRCEPRLPGADSLASRSRRRFRAKGRSSRGFDACASLGCCPGAVQWPAQAAPDGPPDAGEARLRARKAGMSGVPLRLPAGPRGSRRSSADAARQGRQGWGLVRSLSAKRPALLQSRGPRPVGQPGEHRLAPVHEPVGRMRIRDEVRDEGAEGLEALGRGAARRRRRGLHVRAGKRGRGPAAEIAAEGFRQVFGRPRLRRIRSCPRGLALAANLFLGGMRVAEHLGCSRAAFATGGPRGGGRRARDLGQQTGQVRPAASAGAEAAMQA